ncbi:YggN family protein [uncultured Paraglaciecola sp.]|uniref:YggN family protein n=1 Tax=uncultured Paraglaciecola sp. TaxID=1765024 RepID=UPI0030D726D4|tara:strand:+ start:16913 stop:17698 length:786 start_codon:yes stop_codon:yes gene_type:complete
MRFLWLIFLCFPIANVKAEYKCDVELNYGLVVTTNQIRVIDNSRTVYQINNDDQLIVKGQWVALSPKQQRELKELADGVHHVVPKMILLASEGVELAIETVEHVYLGLVGDEHDSYEKLRSSLARVQSRVKEKFIHAGSNFYMGPGTLENVDDLVDRELEEQIEEAMNTSLGGILSAIGGLVSESTSTEEKIAKLAEKIDSIGNSVDEVITSKGQTLQQKAHWFCNEFNRLDRVENRLRRDIPELAQYDVVSSSQSRARSH